MVDRGLAMDTGNGESEWGMGMKMLFWLQGSFYSLKIVF